MFEMYFTGVGLYSDRYNSLARPLQRRKENLEAWQVLFHFYRNVEEETAWLNDRLPSITAKDLGSSLSSSQQLLHKHQVRKEENISKLINIHIITDIIILIGHL